MSFTDVHQQSFIHQQSFTEVQQSFNSINREKSFYRRSGDVKKRSVQKLPLDNAHEFVIDPDAKYVHINFGSTGGSGNCMFINTDQVETEFMFNPDEDEVWMEFDATLKIVMPILLSNLGKVKNLELLNIDYNVEDEYVAENFLPLFKDLSVQNISYISLMVRGCAVHADVSVLTPEFVDKLYLECPECCVFFKASDVVPSEHNH